MKVANDYAYQKIHSAEKAVLRIRERGQKAKTQKQNQTAPVKPMFLNGVILNIRMKPARKLVWN